MEDTPSESVVPSRDAGARHQEPTPPSKVVPIKLVQPGPATCLLVLGSSSSPKRVSTSLEMDLDQVTFTLGASRHNNLRLCDSSVSRLHAHLQRIDGGVEVVDAESRHGVVVQGIRVERYRAMIGAPFQLGDVRVAFLDDRLRQLGRELARAVGLEGEDRVVADETLIRLQSERGVVLLGEQGCDQERLARAMAVALRPHGPCIVVGCRPGDGECESLLRGASGGTLVIDVDTIGAIPRRLVDGLRSAYDVLLVLLASTASAIEGASGRPIWTFKTVSMKPLRQRPGDIPTLLFRLLREAGSDVTSTEMKQLDLRAFSKLPWHRNFDELRESLFVVGAVAKAKSVADAQRRLEWSRSKVRHWMEQYCLSLPDA